jgi:hypothetical protein
MAVEIAMKKNPALLDSPAVLNLMGYQARLTDRGRKLAEEATTQIIRHKSCRPSPICSPADRRPSARPRPAWKR